MLLVAIHGAADHTEIDDPAPFAAPVLAAAASEHVRPVLADLVHDVVDPDTLSVSETRQFDHPVQAS